jgi:hypothetical protein
MVLPLCYAATRTNGVSLNQNRIFLGLSPLCLDSLNISGLAADHRIATHPITGTIALAKITAASRACPMVNNRFPLILIVENMHVMPQ